MKCPAEEPRLLFLYAHHTTRTVPPAALRLPHHRATWRASTHACIPVSWSAMTTRTSHRGVRHAFLATNSCTGRGDGTLKRFVQTLNFFPHLFSPALFRSHALSLLLSPLPSPFLFTITMPAFIAAARLSPLFFSLVHACTRGWKCHWEGGCIIWTQLGNRVLGVLLDTGKAVQ